MPFFADRATFLACVQDHFHRQDEPVLGDEPAAIAADRLAAVVERHALTNGTVAVLVSHGRIMASFLARVSQSDPWATWQSLTMPDSYVVEPGPTARVTRVPAR